ncbi:MAG: DNA-processing protein DprA [Patescibacteria group bacterium]
MSDREYYLAFSNASGVGPKSFGKLVKAFGSAKNAWNAKESELLPVLKKSLTSKFVEFRKEFDFDSYLTRLSKQKISYVCLFEKDYPELLKKIPNPPIVLFTKGNKKIFHPEKLECLKMIAIVGTRRITAYGRAITEMFAEELASSGLVIVSGMAFGVDGVAHKAALSVGGRTIAVLGNGVDLPYPRENQKLYEEILDSNGAIVSEFPPGEPPSVGSFPSRNRIIAGLSLGVLVTEGASDSGSLITASFGLEFGRKVFAVPGPITSSLSAAPLRLIEKGAKLVVSPSDIIKELGIKNYELRKGKKETKFVGLSKDEKKIVEILENESLLFDEIVRRLKLNPSKTATLLSFMEIKGILKNSGGSYSIA